MGRKAEIRLDILIKKEEDYFLAHCLQFDIVTTADTLKEVRKDIIDLCRAHIEYAHEYDNLDYLFSPAPKEAWAEYLAMSKKEDCDVENTSFHDSPRMNPFTTAQEVYCYA
jgi:predicted RNase H-like HicB family nuclease